MRCRFSRNVFRNEENGYCVAQFWTADDSIPDAARRHQAEQGTYITAFGYNLPYNEEVEAELVGKWVNHPQYGPQFEVESYMEVVPRTKEGIVGYLSSGAIKGIGRKTAEAIYSYFGMDTLEVIEKTPDKLLCIRGISQAKLNEIKVSYGKNQTFRELMTFLAPFQVSPKKVQKIILEFGGEAPDIIRTRPYRLCAIKGFGFLTVDTIARNCGASSHDPMRLSGCIAYVLKQACKEGHLFLPQESLVQSTLELLNKDVVQDAVTEREVQNVLYRLSLQGSIVVEKQRIYEVSCYEAENETARMVVRHLLDRVPSVPVDQAIRQAEKALGLALSKSQESAVRMVFNSSLSIITGGPGTGKTTVLQIILYIHKMICKGEVQLMAPTGRAARRMAESTGQEASTMHMALGLVGDAESYQEFSYLDAQFHNVDEFSMVEMKLAYEFFRRLKAGVRIVLIGDVDQLPSVGPGDVFRQLIQCGLIPVTVLDLVFRQAENSRININAKLIKTNKAGLSYGRDFQFIETKGDEETAAIVQKLYQQAVAQTDVESVQVLSPYRVKSASGVIQLNEALRELVNPEVSGMYQMKAAGRVFRTGDKVLQTKNTDIVSNGDIGFIQQFYKDKDGECKAEILFSDQRKVVYEAGDMENIELAYATTIHKSQGSEYPIVILPWIKRFYGMLKRNILYTAITRAKAQVIIVGEKSALYQAIHTDDSGKRNTALGEKILENYQELAAPEEKERLEQLKLAI